MLPYSTWHGHVPWQKLDTSTARVDFLTRPPALSAMRVFKHHLSLVPCPPHSAPHDIPSPQIHFIGFKHPLVSFTPFRHLIFLGKLSSLVDILSNWPQSLQTTFCDPQWMSNHPHDCFSVIIIAHPPCLISFLLLHSTYNLLLASPTYFSFFSFSPHFTRGLFSLCSILVEKNRKRYAIVTCGRIVLVQHNIHSLYAYPSWVLPGTSHWHPPMFFSQLCLYFFRLSFWQYLCKLFFSLQSHMFVVVWKSRAISEHSPTMWHLGYVSVEESYTTTWSTGTSHFKVCVCDLVCLELYQGFLCTCGCCVPKQIRTVRIVCTLM